MLMYRHWAIIAFSENLSDIIVLENCEVYTTKSQYSFGISLKLSKKGHNSVKSLRMTSNFEFVSYVIMLYLSVNFQ